MDRFTRANFCLTESHFAMVEITLHLHINVVGEVELSGPRAKARVTANIRIINKIFERTNNVEKGFSFFYHFYHTST